MSDIRYASSSLAKLSMEVLKSRFRIPWYVDGCVSAFVVGVAKYRLTPYVRSIVEQVLRHNRMTGDPSAWCCWNG